MQLLLPSSWGPQTHGVPVVVNEKPNSLGPVIALDIETDELDHFVGGCVYDGGSSIYYITDAVDFKSCVAGKKVIGYNIKSDLNWLRLMGLSVGSADIFSDPMIQAYVVNSNRKNQGLKEVAHEVLGWTWPSYKQMVGKGKQKKTLDKQDMEVVAEYCGMDTLATWRLHEHFTKTFNVGERNLYDRIELPLYRMLWDMEVKGVKFDPSTCDILDKELGDDCQRYLDMLHMYDSTWNPNSPPQTLKVMNRLGIKVKKTDKPTLTPYRNTEPVVDTLLKYKKLKKLHSTYIVPYKGKTEVHTTFNQVSMDQSGELHGIRTGRLSSSEPNLQNIPAKRKGETYGERIRSLFIPTSGKVFIDADYSQIEYRLLAHYSQEPHLVRGFQQGLDVHEVTGRLLGCSRDVGKTLNFASIYGAQSQKIADTAKCTVAEAEAFLQSYWRNLPSVAQWIGQVKLLAKGRGGVTTMSGRFVPLADLTSRNKWDRLHAERASVNYIIQGSAADIIKVAMNQLKDAGYLPVLQVHDELIFEVNPVTAQEDLIKIKAIMENVVKLSVPLVADIHIGMNWNDAKS